MHISRWMLLQKSGPALSKVLPRLRVDGEDFDVLGRYIFREHLYIDQLVLMYYGEPRILPTALDGLPPGDHLIILRRSSVSLPPSIVPDWGVAEHGSQLDVKELKAQMEKSVFPEGLDPSNYILGVIRMPVSRELRLAKGLLTYKGSMFDILHNGGRSVATLGARLGGLLTVIVAPSEHRLTHHERRDIRQAHWERYCTLARDLPLRSTKKYPVAV